MISDQANSNFLAAMSHEIRTPLNGILGFADFMAVHPDLPESLREHVQTIQQSGRDLLRVVNDILNYGHLKAGAIQIEHREFSPRKVLEDVRALLAPIAKAKELELRLADVPEAVPETLLGDRERLAQILLNLGGNAVKFTERGALLVGCRRGSGSTPGRVPVEFYVKDTGIGIPADRLARIFEPYQQADVSTSRIYGGIGLGLTIARSLVELMGGTLEVASEEGVGSTFSFRIEFETLTREAPPPTAGPAAADALAEKFPLRILVAEDDAINRRVIEKLLNGFGYSPVCVGDGTNAVNAFQREKPQCVIMDLRMPEMDGMEATRRIRAIERSAGTPPCRIIALTAGVLPEERQHCFEAGMDEHLVKPIRLEELEGALKRAARS